MSILLVCEYDPVECAGWQAALEAALPGERWVRRRGGAADAEIEIAIVANPPPGTLQGLPRLRLIQSLWAGVDGLLADPTLPAGVPLARMADPAMDAAMVETALWAVLMLHRGFHRYARLQREARWAPHAQRRADEVTVAVLGLGRLGSAAARRLALQGYRVIGWRARAAGASAPLPAAMPESLRTFAGIDALGAEVLPSADVVVNLLPLTPATRDLFDARRLACFKPGAALVNLARGAHVVEADLIAALDAGALGHAVLDVFRTEPLAATHPFWRHPHVTVLPHAAAQTDPRSAAELAAANVRALRAGRELAHLADRGRGY